MRAKNISGLALENVYSLWCALDESHKNICAWLWNMYSLWCALYESRQNICAWLWIFFSLMWTNGRSSELCSAMFLNIWNHLFWDSNTFTWSVLPHWSSFQNKIYLPSAIDGPSNGQAAKWDTMHGRWYFDWAHIYIFPWNPWILETPVSSRALVNKGKPSVPWNPEAFGSSVPLKHWALETLWVLKILTLEPLFALGIDWDSCRRTGNTLHSSSPCMRA